MAILKTSSNFYKIKVTRLMGGLLFLFRNIKLASKHELSSLVNQFIILTWPYDLLYTVNHMDFCFKRADFKTKSTVYHTAEI